MKRFTVIENQKNTQLPLLTVGRKITWW